MTFGDVVSTVGGYARPFFQATRVRHEVHFVNIKIRSCGLGSCGFLNMLRSKAPLPSVLKEKR